MHQTQLQVAKNNSTQLYKTTRLVTNCLPITIPQYPNIVFKFFNAVMNIFISPNFHCFSNVSTGILVVEKPCATVVDIKELFGSESKTQVYAHLHNLWEKTSMNAIGE